MFGFKKKTVDKDCSTCEVERIKELQEEKRALQAKLDDLNSIRNVCVYDLIGMNLRKGYRESLRCSSDKALAEAMAKIVWYSMSGKYSGFEDAVSQYFFSPNAFVRQLVDFLNGYLEWSDNRLGYEQKINKANYEIKVLKDKLGIE